VFRKWSDFDFLIVALIRFRRCVKLTAKIPEIHSEILAALKEFDTVLPHLKKMRDVAEHIAGPASTLAFPSTADPRRRWPKKSI
jgi:hypothetical protein